MRLEAKNIEIFCGTGGVGKTTLATARALSLASNKKVLLITIDPSKRLRDILNIQSQGRVENIIWNNISIDAQLMDPQQTIKSISEIYNIPELTNNKIISVLTKPFGGMNEILSLIELQLHLNKNYYDHIILDTPPGPHFLDFLESMEKINKFFDSTFMDIFRYLEKSKSANFSTDLIKKIFSSGMNKLLSYLENVTGAEFIQQFVNAINIIYSAQEPFKEALKLQDSFKDIKKSNLFIVSSIEQGKSMDATQIASHAGFFVHNQQILLLNKCFSSLLANWNPQNTTEQLLKKSIIDKELTMKNDLVKSFKTLIEFPEITENSPQEHLRLLTSEWKKYEL